MKITSTLSATLAAVLPALVTATALAVAAAERSGHSLLSNGGPLNAAEAAAIGDASTVLRFLAFGESPVQVQPVRPEFISADVPLATTLEAALWSRQPGLLKLLDERHAIVGEAERHHLACLANEIKAPDLVEYLAPAGLAPCGADMGFARLIARANADRR